MNQTGTPADKESMKTEILHSAYIAVDIYHRWAFKKKDRMSSMLMLCNEEEGKGGRGEVSSKEYILYFWIISCCSEYSAWCRLRPADYWDHGPTSGYLQNSWRKRTHRRVVRNKVVLSEKYLDKGTRQTQLWFSETFCFTCSSESWSQSCLRMK